MTSLPDAPLPAPPSPDDGKQAWRAHARAIRRALAADAPRHAALSAAVQARVLQSPLWRAHDIVLLYRAVKGEVDTDALLRAALAQGKRVFLPRCRPDDPGRMDMLACCDPAELLPSANGIPEPPAQAPCLPPGDLPGALVIVPALAFDRQGYRLGYGGGYYDRLLAAGAGASLGLAFGALVFPQLPRDPWDVPVAALATEEGLTCL